MAHYNNCLCPICKKGYLKKNNGQYGEFYGCSNRYCAFTIGSDDNYEIKNAIQRYNRILSLSNVLRGYNNYGEGEDNLDGMINAVYSSDWVGEKEFKVKQIKENDDCLLCGGKLLIKKGKYGDFLGCINYPDCNFSIKVGAKVIAKAESIKE